MLASLPVRSACWLAHQKTKLHMPSLSYSKWDSIDSGSEDEGPGLTPAADFAQQLLSQWIREATNIDAGDSMRLIDFVSLSMPRLNHGDNMSRAAEVIEFLDRHSPSSSALLDVLWWCRTKDEDTTDPGERTKVMKLPLAHAPWRLAYIQSRSHTTGDEAAKRALLRAQHARGRREFWRCAPAI